MKTTETIKLTVPMTIDGVDIKEVTVRRPKVKDQLDAQRSGKGEGEIELHLIARLTGLNPVDITEKMDLDDFFCIRGVVHSFLPSLLKTFAKP